MHVIKRVWLRPNPFGYRLFLGYCFRLWLFGAIAAYGLHLVLDLAYIFVGLGACLLSGLLGLIAQLDRFILDQDPGLSTRLGREQQGKNRTGQGANQNSNEKHSNPISVRHGNLLKVIFVFGYAQTRLSSGRVTVSF